LEKFTLQNAAKLSTKCPHWYYLNKPTPPPPPPPNINPTLNSKIKML